MRFRQMMPFLVCLLFVAGALWLWRAHQRREAQNAYHLTYTAPRPGLPGNPSAAKILPAHAAAAMATNQMAFRLSNTDKSLAQLVGDSHAILLENALIDTTRPLNLSIPAHLKAKGDAGSYIVQSRGAINGAFQAALAQAGAQIISYIPNNSYLVKITADVADELAKQPAVQAVIPYEPYYKIKFSLLPAAIAQDQLPDEAVLTLGLYADGASQTISQIENLGGKIVGQSRSPFGPVVRVLPPQNWTALASLPGVQIVEPFYRRVLANDLSREVLGVSVDSVAPTNYMNLYGSNVIVMVNDSGIDTNHPDLQGRVYYDDPAFGIDTDGHGTHVAGIIGGSGLESTTVTNAPGSIITNGASPNFTASPFQFRGKAPLASLFSIGLNDDEGGIDLDLPGQSEDTSDLIQADAQTNALISNNSWVFDGDNTYDLDAASYDAATRDVQPLATGAQPMLFVFAAANDGDGDNDGGSGQPGVADSIMSPATAKDVVTVGAVEELRNIVVTPPVTNADGSTGQPWQPQTDNSSQVAGFSSRGNVGVGTEGQFGRFKPDVVAPGTMVISTRSEQWDITDYFYQDPTNNDIQTYTGLIVQPGSTFLNGFPVVPDNAIGVTINLFPNANSPVPFPSLPIYVGLLTSPGFDFMTTNNAVTIPLDGGAGYLDSIKSSETFFGFKYAVSNATSEPIDFDLQTDVITTNAIGDYLLALSNLDNSIGTFNPNSTGPGPYYRYESGTSMSAADISGVLALMQDFFINHSPLTNPSPALLKAMLINGARLTGTYDYQINSTINFEGWGLANLPNSLPLTIQTNFDGTQPSSIFIQDQSVTNALATGDSQTFYFTVSTNASVLPLHVTLAWTDPPGDPAAAIKLVNNLDLIISNMDTGDTYFGNDIPTGGFYNEAWGTNSSDAGPLTNAVNVADAINNVEQVILPPGLSQHYAITVFGKDVNVNAVSQQTNTYASNINPAGTFAPNIVQDFALVVNCGDGEVPGAFTVTNGGVVTGFANGITNNVTIVTSTNSTLVNQFVGASSPLMGTNQVAVGDNGQWNPAGEITLGETNQWHFYVITNTGTNSEFTNAAFITFLPPTLATPTMGVYEDSITNATRPEADIDLYVTTDPNLLLLDPTTISNCVNGTQVGMSTGTSPNFVFNGVSLSRGGTEFVADTNSTPGEVYYVGVKSEDQMASEYDFLPVFTKTPFSQMTNGNEIVNGIALPTDIPDGTPLHPGVTNILMLALFPIDVADVIVTVTNTHQNFGDVIGTLHFNDSQVVLNNHDAYGAISNQFIYDDGDGSGTNGIAYPGSQRSDGPGSLQSFAGDSALGVWRLAEVDDSPGQTGTVQNVSMLIEPHRPLNKGVNVTIGPTNWFYDFIDVPAGVTNLTIFGTNVTVTINPLGPDPANPLEMVEKFGGQATLTNADKGPVFLTNGIAIGAGGTGLGNFISVGPGDVPPIQPGRYWVGIYNPSPTVSQDAFIIATLAYQGQGSAIDFDSTGSANILDDAVTYSTIFCGTDLPVASLNVGIFVDDPRISDLVFHLISPDGTRMLLMENRGGDSMNGAGASVIVTNVVTNVMTSITVTNVMTNNLYLTFTEDTNLTDTPIKFAEPPFVPDTNTVVLSTDSFEGIVAADYTAGQSFGTTGWTVTTNQISLVTDSVNADDGSNFIALASGVISNTLPTIAGNTYTLTFAYRGPGIAGWWRAEGNTNDSINGNNPSSVSNITFVNGEVGQAFSYDGSTSLIAVPASASLPISNLTVEAWIYQTNDNLGRPIFDLGGGGGSSDVQLWVNTTGGSSVNPGGLNAIYRNSAGGIEIVDASPVVVLNQWNHLALTTTPNTLILYCNGVQVASGTFATPVTPENYAYLDIGYRDVNTSEAFSSAGRRFLGNIDEASIYSRILSASEVKAIYTDGTNGKFDPTLFDTSPSQSLAEAQISVDGQTPTITGDNTSWQTETITFTATQNGTPIQIAGTEPGMLLDDFVLTQVPGDIYYLPEQSLDAFDGESALGDWTLEIQDDRAGAGLTNLLVSWELQFIFANTNPVPLVLNGGIGESNEFLPANDIAWYQINVPANADIATNLLLFASAPVNVWWSINVPPTITNPNDVDLIPGSTGNTGSPAILYTNAPPPPPYIVPGGIYYLGVQNTNNFTVNYGIKVNFDVLGEFSSVPLTISSVSASGSGTTLNWTASPSAEFQVQWTDDLTQPWNTDPQIITSNNGNFSFTDNGSETAPLGTQRFYRLVQIAP